jgi:hypothetical protein
MGLDVSVSFGTATNSAAMWGVNPSNTAANSYEQIFSPILIRKASGTYGSIPSFEMPYGGYESGPFGYNQVGPTRNELDPYFSKVLGGDGTYWITQCDYQMMVNNGYGPKGEDLNIRKVNRNQVSQVAVNALRGPLILSGWGFDVCDRPVPAASYANPFQFAGNVVNNRATWKTGPVNLQWDDQRKVWQGGPQIVCGVASGPIKAPTNPCYPTSFSVKVFRKGAAGLSACHIGESITCWNRDPSLTQEAVTGMVFVVAVRINYEWIPIWVGCPEGPSGTTPPCSDC